MRGFFPFDKLRVRMTTLINSQQSENTPGVSEDFVARLSMGGMVALEVFVEGVEAGAGQEVAESFVIAVAGGEVGTVETAKLVDGGAGASLVVGVGLGCGIANWRIGFVFAEEGVGGVGHRIGSLAELLREMQDGMGWFVWLQRGFARF
jgi:hypothetical protein